MSEQLPDAPTTKPFDADAFAFNVARAMESGGKALAAFLKPRESGDINNRAPGEMAKSSRPSPRSRSIGSRMPSAPAMCRCD